MNQQNEKSGKPDEGFQNWKNELLNGDLTPDEISLKIRDKILESPQLSTPEQKQFYIDVYDYVKKLIDRGKPLEINLLRIYLEEVKGYDLTVHSIIATLILVSACGIQLNAN